MENKEYVRNWAKKFFDENQKDFETFDFDSYYDDKLTISENQNHLRSKINKLFEEQNKKNVKVMPKEQYDVLVAQEIQKAEKQATLEFEKALEKIEKDNTTTIIEDIYFLPKQYAKMVANGKAKGFILYGEAGLGKSYTIMRAFREEKKDFVYISGHITPLELYNFLFKHRNDNLILDDVNVLGNEINLNMLKSCLNDNSRLVSYNTSSSRLKVPDKFIFDGTICLLLNIKPSSNENLKAVESRVLNYELKLSYEDKLKVIFELAKNDYEGLTQEDRNIIVNWIKNNTNKATKNLNLRILFHFFEMYKFDKANWEKMAKSLLLNDEYMSLILTGISCQEFCFVTGKSKATYFRYKDNLKNNSYSVIPS